MKKYAALIGSALVVASQASHAALDTAVTTAISSAQTDLLSLMTALTTAGAAIWVGRLIYNKFKVR